MNWSKFVQDARAGFSRADDQWASHLAAVPDLSICGGEAERLRRSRWLAVTDVYLPETGAARPAEELVGLIKERLQGREAHVRVEDGKLLVGFSVENANDESRRRVLSFGRAVARLVAGSDRSLATATIGHWDSSDVDEWLPENERPMPYGGESG